jgi:probable HAF family extracellular repeat protein
LNPASEETAMPLSLPSCRIVFSNQLAVCALWLTTGAVVRGADYNVVDLGAGLPTDINNKGQIVGYGPTAAFLHDGTNRFGITVNATYWNSPPGGPPPTPYTLDYAFAINDSGAIAGSVLPIPAVPSTRTAIVTDGKGGGLLFSFGSTADAINNAGRVLGGTGPAFVFDGTNAMVIQSSLTKFHSVNADGIAVGSIAPNFVQDRAATFDLSGNPDLINLGAVVPAALRAYSSTAYSINDAGQIVGAIRSQNGRPEADPEPAFLVSGGVAQSLGSLGGIKAAAYDINNLGVIVGDSTLPDTTLHAFLYRSGTMTDLNTLIANSGWILTSARAINDQGQIVGYGTFNGQDRAFLLNPIKSGGTQPPSIVAQPVGGSFALGATTTLSVGVTGNGPFTYEWQKDGKTISGATASSLTLTPLRGTDTGIYRVIIRNATGSATSNEVTLTVLDPLLSSAQYSVVQVRGEVGGKYQIEYVNRADSADWQTLTTITLTKATQLVLDEESITNRFRLYRSKRVP